MNAIKNFFKLPKTFWYIFITLLLLFVIVPSSFSISNNPDPNIVYATLSPNWTVVVAEPAMYIRNIIINNEKLEPLYFTSQTYCIGALEDSGCWGGTRNLTLFGAIITYIVVVLEIYLSSIIIAYGIGRINIHRNKYI